VAVLPGFIGASGRLRSPNVNNEETINWFVASSGSGTPKAPAWLCPTPGIRIYAATGSGPIHPVWEQDGRCFAVGGVKFNEILSTQNVVTYSPDLAYSASRPASIVSNGSGSRTRTDVGGGQLFIECGHRGYVFDLLANSLVDVNLDFQALMADYVEDRFVSLIAGTKTLRWSDLNDGTSWPALNFAQNILSSDNLVAMKVIHGQIWLFGTKTTSAWAGVGGVDVFAPILGSMMQHGCAAAYSVQVIDNAPFWVGSNEHGTGIVYRGQGVGAVPTVVSTPAVEYSLGTAPRLSDAIGLTFQLEGNPFYAIYVPSLDLSWLYNIRLGPEHGWTKWGHWDDVMLRWIPHVATSHAYVFNRHLVGSRLNDVVYDLSLDYASDQLVP
jgi:hypothetical protein